MSALNAIDSLDQLRNIDISSISHLSDNDVIAELTELTASPVANNDIIQYCVEHDVLRQVYVGVRNAVDAFHMSIAQNTFYI